MLTYNIPGGNDALVAAIKLNATLCVGYSWLSSFTFTFQKKVN